MPIQQIGIIGIFKEGGFVADGFYRFMCRDTSPVLAAGQVPEPVAHGSEPGYEGLFVPPQQIGKSAYTRRFK